LDVLQKLSTSLPLSPKEISTAITPVEFISVYKVVNEVTLSSPTGHHVGHYKVAATDPLLSELHTTLMSNPYTTNHDPSLQVPLSVDLSNMSHLDSPLFSVDLLLPMKGTPIGCFVSLDTYYNSPYISTFQLRNAISSESSTIWK
jgi:hypothetical protein